MRIGTWNLDAKHGRAHVDFLHRLECDVLLLTEVSLELQLDGYVGHRTRAVMARGQHFAAIFSKVPPTPLPDPHGASALATIADITCCASILPWRACGSEEPWTGASLTEKTERAVAAIVASRPCVWGGDWNHALEGPETAGSLAGRAAIQRGIDQLGLLVATRAAPHRLEGLSSIDHIAVPRDWIVGPVQHVPAGHLSDHDAYVVDWR
jgi:hypothetical protein